MKYIICIMMVAIISGACQNTDDHHSLTIGDSYEQDGIILTPTEIEVIEGGDDFEGMDINPSSQAVITTIKINNNSDTDIHIDEEFYYSFGLIFEEDLYDDVFLGRMDLDLHMWDLYEGTLEPNDSVQIEIVLFIGEGSLIELIFDESNHSYEPDSEFGVRWDIQM